jgi:hypothetical protein
MYLLIIIKSRPNHIYVRDSVPRTNLPRELVRITKCPLLFKMQVIFVFNLNEQYCMLKVLESPVYETIFLQLFIPKLHIDVSGHSLQINAKSRN